MFWLSEVVGSCFDLRRSCLNVSIYRHKILTRHEIQNEDTEIELWIVYAYLRFI